MLGDELVPDYLTSVRDGAFYGWPYSYFGQNEDPRKKGQRPDLVAKAIKPDYALGSHVAPLGLAFYRGKSFPERYHGGAFIGMHGSWNRSIWLATKLPSCHLKTANRAAQSKIFLPALSPTRRAAKFTVALSASPVWTDGSLLVADDAAGKIWRVSAKK